MNKTHLIVWAKARQGYVVAHEKVAARRQIVVHSKDSERSGYRRVAGFGRAGDGGCAPTKTPASASPLL